MFRRATGTFRGLTVLCALVIGVCVATTRKASAQETTATILGAVTDSSGGVLPGVTLSIKHVETAQVRTAVTDGQGRYRVPSLPVGHYEITGQLEGFQTVVRSGVTLTVSQEAVVNFTLSIGSMSEQVMVSAAAPIVETTNSTVSALVDEQQMRALPLNGRSFDQLALLQPGVTTMPFIGSDITSGTGKEVIVAGSRWGSTLFLLDGTEITEGRNTSSASGNILGVEGVQEFRVLTQNVNAEYGRASGGIITAITRSGSNDFHGSAYEFVRNNHLDTPNYFDQGEMPPFTRNQYGGAVGGPLKHDKTFFFANVEILRERLGQTNVAIVPNANAHQGLLIDSKTGQPTAVGITATAKSFLDTFYPLPNAGDLAGTDAGLYLSNPTSPTDDRYFTTKIDHVLSQSNRLFGRFVLDNSKTANDLNIPIGRNQGTIKKYFLTVEDSMVLSSRALNVVRVGNNYDQARDIILDTVDAPERFRFVPGVHLGQLQIPGFTNLGESGSLPRYVLNHLFQISDDFSFDTGRHTFKVGGMVNRYRSDTQFARRNNGRYSATSLLNFERGIMRQFEAPMPNTDTQRRWLQYLFAVYAQDDMRLGSNFKVNYGVRYEPYTRPDELDGKLSNLLDPLGPPSAFVHEFFHDNPSLKNVQPRVGMAWDIFGDGKSSLRAAFGRFQNPQLPSTYALDGTRMPPYFQSATLLSPPFPNAYSLFQSASGLNLARDISIYDPHMRTPTYDKWHVTFERELMGSMKAMIGYSGNRGFHLLRQHEGNTVRPTILADGSSFFPAGGVVRNPSFGSELVSTTDVESNYHALETNLVRRMKNGLQFQVAYTYSKHIDDGSGTLGGTLETQGAGSGLVSTDPDDLSRDWGLSAWDRRHVFSFNSSYELPFGSDRAVKMGGFADHVFGGWTANTIVTLSSGVPLNVVVGTFDSLRNLDQRTPNRPNLAAGASNNPIIGDGRDPLHYFDPTVFLLPTPGTFGNLARNTLISPGVATVDLALVKKATLTAGSALDLRVEAFNLLDRANFGQPGRQIFASNGSYLPSAGVITNTTTPSRQIQLSARFTF